jgi:S-sulfo-L-cysteine synthase (3-phospho-L-serine-dependent)
VIRSRVVLVESNTSGTGALFVRTATDLGFEPVLLTADASRYDFAEHPPRVLTIDTSSVAEVVLACAGLVSDGGPVAGVLTSSEYYTQIAAAAARYLGLPANSPEAVRVTRNKGEQRRALADAGVPQPEFGEAASLSEAVARAERIGFPVVVKPVTGSGSSGVRLCTTGGEVEEHARRLLAVTANERGQRVPRRVLVERAVAGPEYSVEVFGGVAVGVTRKHLGPRPWFVEVGHDFPAPLAPGVRERVADQALAAARHLGLRVGPAHVEVRDSGAGPLVIEVNPRLAGGWIPRLVQWATGVDLVVATVRAAVGEKPDLRPTRADSAAVRFVLPAHDGVLAEITGVEDARRAPHVVETRLYRQPGAQLRRTDDFRDRIGHVLTHATTTPTAARAADHAVGLITPVLQDEEARHGPRYGH